jgi:ribosomal protein L16 Arg81 hydroxylase
MSDFLFVARFLENDLMISVFLKKSTLVGPHRDNAPQVLVLYCMLKKYNPGKNT